MTKEERLNIFIREVVGVKDFMILFDCSRDVAYEKIRAIKSSGKDRLQIAGKIHIQDYIDYYKLPLERYLPEVVIKIVKEG